MRPFWIKGWVCPIIWKKKVYVGKACKVFIQLGECQIVFFSYVIKTEYTSRLKTTIPKYMLKGVNTLTQEARNVAFWVIEMMMIDVVSGKKSHGQVTISWTVYFKLVGCFKINLWARYCQKCYWKQRSWIYLVETTCKKTRARKSSG